MTSRLVHGPTGTSAGSLCAKGSRGSKGEGRRPARAIQRWREKPFEGARPAALALARVAVERFRREGGALHLTDALTGLCRDVHLSEAEVAAEDPVLQRWIPVQLRLEAAGPFVARHTWVREESTAYDEFLYGATGRSFDSFLEEARGKAPHGRFGRARLSRSAGDMLRTWGVAELIRVLREPPDDGA